MPFLVGQCCVDQIITPDPEPSDLSGKNEVIPFGPVSTVTIPWNSTRKARFGDAAVFQVELIGEDGKYRKTEVEIIPNNITNTTSYAFDLGAVLSGRVIIT